MPAAEWERLERGFKQRLEAINLFLGDIYGRQQLMRDGLVPRELILGSPNYMREMAGIEVPHGAYVNICGTDVIRNEAGDYVVLEDNLRVPSGVSYMLANREAVKRTFPDIYRSAKVRPWKAIPMTAPIAAQPCQRVSAGPAGRGPHAGRL